MLVGVSGGNHKKGTGKERGKGEKKERKRREKEENNGETLCIVDSCTPTVYGSTAYSLLLVLDIM